VFYKHNDKKRLYQNSKVYFVLPQKTWTPLLAEHFWEHTKLPCFLSFCRAKVHPHGKFYIKVIGKCSIRESHFEGIVLERPSQNSRYFKVTKIILNLKYYIYHLLLMYHIHFFSVLMEFSYIGNFDEVYKAKKRRIDWSCAK
jgi:hypothetical protein